MMTDQRYDIVYGKGGVKIEPHFCREYYCFGTNPDHGFELNEAIDCAIQYHEQQIKLWKTKQHPNLLCYTKENENV